jgi:hypothetical protein
LRHHSGVRQLLVLAILPLAISSCGSGLVRKPDRNDDLVACLVDHGGQRIRSAADLVGVPMPHVIGADGAALESVEFYAIHFRVPRHPQQGREVVVVDRDAEHWPEGRFIRSIQDHPERYDAVVLLRASRDPSGVLWDCQEHVAPGEAFP